MNELLYFLTTSLPRLASEGGLMDFIIHHVIDQDVWRPIPLSSIAVHFPSFQLGPVVFKNGLHLTMLFIASFLTILLFGFLFNKKSDTAPKGLSNFLEMLVVFVKDEICVEHLGKTDGRRMAPFFLTLFFFILTLNLMGLVPALSTATANVNVTGALALTTLAGMIVYGIGRNGPLNFLKIFIPSGVPLVITPLIFLLEFAGLFIKPFALTLRLFANMLAGHIVILAITGVVVGFGVSGLPLLALTIFIYLLEILVAFLQAYIFTLLSAIFIGEMLHPHH